MEQNDIKKLFAVLQSRYGHKWTTAYDDPAVMSIAVQEWHRELNGFRPEDIRNGLERWRDPWPPSLPEFVDACMPDLDELGFDVEAMVNRRLPDYLYAAQTSKEEIKRQERELAIRNDVIEEVKRTVRKLINADGVEALINSGETISLSSMARAFPNE